MTDAPGIRASDAERDQAIDRLRDAAGEGRLTLEELTDRIGVAAGARTRGELARLTDDLPAGAPGGAPAPAAGAIQSVFGDVRRAGRWQVPASSRWGTVFGDVVLDLREASVEAPEVAIEASSVFGDVDLLVPEGVAVEVRSRTFFGDVRQEVGDTAAPGAPRVLLTGGTFFGDVRVRTRRLREKLADRLLRS